MRKIAVVAAALVLGYASPWLASPDDGAILFAWFNWLPASADRLLLLEGWAALTLDVSVMAAQYLALFAVLAALRPAAKVAADFIRGPRHRTGLVR